MKLCLECGADLSMRHKRTKRCVRCAITAKSRTNAEQKRIRRSRQRERRALYALQHDEATCPDCHTSLWGAPVRCYVGQTLHDERMRAEGARAKKPAAICVREREDAARIERQLARLAACRRRDRHRLTLTDEDCWRGVGSLAGAAEGAEA